MSAEGLSERESRPSLRPAPRVIRAQMNFVIAPQDVRRVQRVYEPDGTSHHPLKAEMLEIHNARELPRAASLSREGFALLSHKTALKNFRDEEELKQVYLPEMAKVVQDITGADRVAMIQGVGRRITDAVERPSLKNALEGAQFVHLDYSAQSVPDFLARALGSSEIDLARYSRIVTYNLWRALSPPPQDMPLAVCDMRTVSLDDLVTANAEFGDRDFKFEISLVRHNPSHRWYYYPNMTPDELLMFKVWTLRPHMEQCVFHGAFYDPSRPKDAAPRVSIEARAFALFE